MPAYEFFDWMLYESIEPFGDRRGDIQASVVASTIANVNRSEKTKPYTVSDFLPTWEPKPEPKQQTPEDAMAVFLALQASQNAIVERLKSI
jgi:hypothetical protein